MKIIQVGKFGRRDELEDHVRGTYGLTPENKKEVVIHGSKEELARVHLSASSLFWGIKCEETEINEKEEVVPVQKEETIAPPKPDRGQRYKSGIDLKPEEEGKIEEK